MEVKIKKLNVKHDKRGWLAEILRAEDLDKKSFGQILVTCAKSHQIKGKHYHKRKTEWFLVIRGEGKLFLKDLKTDQKKNIKLTESELRLVKIPPFTYHSLENIGKGALQLLAYVDEAFNQLDSDTYYE